MLDAKEERGEQTKSNTRSRKFGGSNPDASKPWADANLGPIATRTARKHSSSSSAPLTNMRVDSALNLRNFQGGTRYFCVTMVLKLAEGGSLLVS